MFNPFNSKEEPTLLSDRSYQDIYSDPGDFVYTKNNFNESVLDIKNNKAYLIGEGYSDAGKFPFIDEMNMKTQKTKRVYQSTLTDKIESISSAINTEDGTFLIRLESKNEFPNYYIRNIKKQNSNTINYI